MDGQRNAMTEEQLAALRGQMNDGRQQTQPSQQVQLTNQATSTIPSQGVPTSQPQSRMSGQQSLREQMRAGRQQATTQQTVMQQTESYQPTQNPQPSPVGGQQTAGQQATSTIINTTQTSDSLGGGVEGKKGFALSKGLVLGIVAIIVVAIIVGYTMLSGSGDDTQGEVTDPVLDEELEWLDPVAQEQFLYAPNEIDTLRAAGYTGTEIENFQSQSIPADELIQKAEAARDAWIQEAVAPLYDTSSDEYKHYVSQTWLTLPQREDMNEWDMLAAYYSERKNLDYEKIDVYGNQLFIKVYLDDNTHDDWFFLNVSPEEWLKLEDSGNVIVNYTYCTRLVGEDYLTAVEDMENIYITEASLEFVE